MTAGADVLSPASIWLADRLAFLRALKSPTAAQRLLLQLADLPERSRQEDREFAALAQLERINERAGKAKVKAHKIVREKEDDARRARNRRLIVQGALVDLAGLADLDRGILLGGLLDLAENLVSTDAPKIQARLKARGDALLASKEKSNPPPVDTRITTPAT